MATSRIDFSKLYFDMISSTQKELWNSPMNLLVLILRFENIFHNVLFFKVHRGQNKKKEKSLVFVPGIAMVLLGHKYCGNYWLCKCIWLSESTELNLKTTIAYRTLFLISFLQSFLLFTAFIFSLLLYPNLNITSFDCV